MGKARDTVITFMRVAYVAKLRRNIRSNKNTTTGQHFQQHNHNMKVTILHVLKYEGESTRKIKEAGQMYQFL